MGRKAQHVLRTVANQLAVPKREELQMNWEQDLKGGLSRVLQALRLAVCMRLSLSAVTCVKL